MIVAGHIEPTQPELDALAWKFLGSEFTTHTYRNWPVDRRVDAYLSHHGLPEFIKDGQAYSALLDRVMANVGPALRNWTAIGRRQQMSTKKVQVRRVYDAPARGDGNRVLVDRIWPRGLTKEKADLDEWCKAIAPSTELRKWYHHDPQRYAEFARRYRDELTEPDRAATLAHLRTLAKDRKNLTLLTASKAVDISEATVLAEMLS